MVFKVSRRFTMILTDKQYEKILEVNAYQNIRRRTTVSNTIRMIVNCGLDKVLENPKLVKQIDTVYNRRQINDSFALFDSIEKEKENK